MFGRRKLRDSLDGVTVGFDASRRPVRLAIRGSHTLIIGLTGSGKGSAIASIVAALCRCSEPWELSFIDLKEGTEAAYYEHLITRKAYNLQEAAELVDGLLDMVRNRAIEMHGQTRNLVPSDAYPQQILVIDEAAELATGVDKKTRETSQHLLQSLDELLRIGRSWGFSCIAATQDPRVEAFKLRPRFPQRLCLRVNDESEAQMCLGKHAVELGARPWLLPSNLPGSCWAASTEGGMPQRFRFRFYTDDEIRGFQRAPR